MKQGTSPSAITQALSRRQMITGAAIALGALAASTRSSAEAQQPAMQEAPGTAANRTRTTLHYQSDLKANPQRIVRVGGSRRQIGSKGHERAQDHCASPAAPQRPARRHCLLRPTFEVST